ncbi:MAG: hypothetical protein ACK55I_31890, partial [bacterium]
MEVERRGNKWPRIGRGGGRVVALRGDQRFLVHVRLADVQDDPEPFVQKDVGVLQDAARADLVGAPILVGTERALEIELLRMGGGIRLPRHASSGAIEGPLCAQIDGARRGVGVDVRADGFG